MALPDHYTGGDGVIKIGGVTQTLVSFNLDVAVGVITQAQIGTQSDKSYPGKKAVSGSITEVLVTGDLFAKLIGDTSAIATSSVEVLLAAFDLDAAAREETAITSDPTAPTSVKCTLTVGDADTAAGSIMIHGTDVNDEQVTETIDFAAMTVGDGAQTKYGSQIFKHTDFVTIMAALEAGTVSYSAIKLEGVTGTKTLTLGKSTYFDLIGKVIDANGKYWQLTAANCFFTAGSFPVGDREELVQTDLPFTMKDPSTLELVWSSV